MSNAHSLSAALKPADRFIEVEPDQIYRFLGVRSFGAGAFDAGERTGTETKYKRLKVVRSGDFVYPKLMAWEGAFAVVPEEFDEYVVSPEFCVFRAVDARADIRFLGHLFRAAETWSAVAGSSSGTNVRRRRLYPQEFLNAKIPLPPLDDQRRMVGLLDATCALATATSHKLGHAAGLHRALLEARIDNIVWDGWSTISLETIAEINPRTPKPAAEEAVSFVPMSAVDDITGRITTAEEVLAHQITSGYKRFRRGDVIFARITPCMQNGKSAVFDNQHHHHGFGSSEFHVLRPTDGIPGAWIHAILRTRRFRDLAAQRFTGTAGQQRVPADFLRSVEVPVPDAIDPVLTELAHVTEQGLELRRLRKRQLEVATGLESAILNRALTGAA